MKTDDLSWEGWRQRWKDALTSPLYMGGLMMLLVGFILLWMYPNPGLMSVPTFALLVAGAVSIGAWAEGS